MKRISFTLILICFFQFLFAQQETKYWYFGHEAGLVFNNGIPTALIDGMTNIDEGCATISDSIGNLLFYTDGVTVWNKNHQIMSNGTGLFGGAISYSTTQAAIIIPQPLNNNIYYIFTVDEVAGYWGGYGGISYSIADMNLQGGLGAITTKNTPLLTPTAEKVTAVLHSNGTDIWIMTQQWGTNSKYAWLLTSAGLNATPVVSNIGTVQNWTGNFNAETQGYMKFSIDGSKLGSAIGPMGIIEVFDFNTTTGVVSNPITINALGGFYGLEFSPDNSRLYSTTWSSKILQWDLTLGSQTAINNSQTLIHQTPFSPTMHITLGLQLAIDCKIYVSIDGVDSLGIIQNPNQLGSLCNYVHNALSLNGKYGTSGFPNFIQSYFNVCNTVGINSISAQPTMSVYPNPTNKVLNLFLDKSGDIIISNTLGDIVLQKNGEGKVELDVSSLSSGIYFIKAGSEVRKFVKE